VVVAVHDGLRADGRRRLPALVVVAVHGGYEGLRVDGVMPALLVVEVVPVARHRMMHRLAVLNDTCWRHRMRDANAVQGTMQFRTDAMRRSPKILPSGV